MRIFSGPCYNQFKMKAVIEVCLFKWCSVQSSSRAPLIARWLWNWFYPPVMQNTLLHLELSTTISLPSAQQKCIYYHNRENSSIFMHIYVFIYFILFLNQHSSICSKKSKSFAKMWKKIASFLFWPKAHTWITLESVRTVQHSLLYNTWAMQHLQQPAQVSFAIEASR